MQNYFLFLSILPTTLIPLIVASSITLKETLTFNRPSQPSQISGNAIINQPVAIVVGEGDNMGALEVDRYWGEQEVTIMKRNC